MSRHRIYQVALTIAMVSTGAMSVWTPEWAHYTAIGGTLVNLAWLWE